jgi:hypothetical protein
MVGIAFRTEAKKTYDLEISSDIPFHTGMQYFDRNV